MSRMSAQPSDAGRDDPTRAQEGSQLKVSPESQLSLAEPRHMHDMTASEMLPDLKLLRRLASSGPPFALARPHTCTHTSILYMHSVLSLTVRLGLRLRLV